jgi:hypothetical protein
LTGFVSGRGPLYTFQARRDLIERDSGFQEDGVNLLTGILLFLRAVFFGPRLALVGLTPVLKPYSNEFDIPVRMRMRRHETQQIKTQATRLRTNQFRVQGHGALPL